LHLMGAGGEQAVMTGPDGRKAGRHKRADASRSDRGRARALPEGDVTQRRLKESLTADADRQNEGEVRTESDRQFRTMFENSLDGIVVADGETRQFYTANPAFCRMLGCTLDEVRQLSAPDIHPHDSVAFAMGQFDKLLRREVSLARDIPVKRKDGSVFYADIHCSPVTHAARACQIGFFRDVTDRKAAEQALRESEERYRTVVESAGETIATFDRQGVLLFVNKMGATCLGGTPADYIGKTMWDIFPREIADRQAASVRNVIDSGRGMTLVTETALQRQKRWYETAIEPIRDAAGRVQAALVIGRDIHELRKAREELEQYQERIDRAEQLASLGTLSATIAHELTQPLTVSRLSLQEAMSQLEASGSPPSITEDLRECLEGISDAAARVERFRTFARQFSKEPPREVRLLHVVERTMRLLEGKAQEHRVSMSMRGLHALPPVRASEKDLEQMCFALIENAIQAADGSKPRRLVIRGRRTTGEIILSFEDNCGGIAPEHADRIFEPFFTTKASGQGAGLGLCVVDRVVTQAHGKTRLENKPGEGTTFHVTLPLPQ